MKTLRQLLAGKAQPLAAVAPKDTVFHALKVMADNHVGAVLVLDGERLVGIFSERDYARKIILVGKASKDTRVEEIMTDKVMYVTPENTIDECMALMTEGRFRHLPVLDGNQQVVGVVSIGDLVKETISEQQFIIDQLKHYITG
ncbi:CBS domain-containing protein [Azospira restricta]|uniref:CBS domain-containing protein n=1 Tax=Azospira restricta TaxID=404405 RepID=A0A974SRI6_9RHOO|nr:CBS domain-containing protein [Azospira restricta]QRJ65109.1 CBS domain-containing protein [Azospira restricta]